jgi:hypothetical protein
MKPYFVGVLLALAACDAQSPTVPVLRLEVLETSIPAGEDIRVRFTSLSTEPLRYNSCYARLERLVPLEWRDVGAASGDVPCRDPLQILPPAGSGEVEFPLASGLPPGTYRLRFTAFFDVDNELIALADRLTDRFVVVN